MPCRGFCSSRACPGEAARGPVLPQMGGAPLQGRERAPRSRKAQRLGMGVPPTWHPLHSVHILGVRPPPLGAALGDKGEPAASHPSTEPAAPQHQPPAEH